MIKLFTLLLLLVAPARPDTCFECSASCQGSQFEACQLEAPISAICQQILACCSGRGLKDAGIDKVTCHKNNCVTIWSYQVENEDQFKTVGRGCNDKWPLKKSGLVTDDSCSNLCEDSCTCQGDLCNQHGSRVGCQWFTDVQKYLAWTVIFLVGLNVLNELFWGRQIKGWKQKLVETCAGDARHGQGYDETRLAQNLS